MDNFCVLKLTAYVDSLRTCVSCYFHFDCARPRPRIYFKSYTKTGYSIVVVRMHGVYVVAVRFRLPRLYHNCGRDRPGSIPCLPAGRPAARHEPRNKSFWTCFVVISLQYGSKSFSPKLRQQFRSKWVRAKFRIRGKQGIGTRARAGHDETGAPCA